LFRLRFEARFAQEALHEHHGSAISFLSWVWPMKDRTDIIECDPNPGATALREFPPKTTSIDSMSAQGMLLSFSKMAAKVR